MYIFCLDLFSVCEAKLVFCISEENAVSLLTYADVLQAQLLYGKCVQFITGHPSLQMSEEFKHLSLKTRTFLEAEYARSVCCNASKQSFVLNYAFLWVFIFMIEFVMKRVNYLGHNQIILGRVIMEGNLHST